MRQRLEKIRKENGKIIIWGCGGHARSIVNSIKKMNDEIEIKLVDLNARENEKILGCKVYREWNINANDYIIIAYGDNNIRKKIYDKLVKSYDDQFISIVSESANIGEESSIGRGTYIAEKAYIGPEVVVGNNSIINTNSVIEHEVIIGNHVHVAPGATICGRSNIRDNVVCGAGSTIIDAVDICENVIIGAGSVVIGNIVQSGTYVGIPAKKIK